MAIKPEKEPLLRMMYYDSNESIVNRAFGATVSNYCQT